MKYIFCLLTLLPGLCIAQQMTISGHIRDKSNGEAIIGATIFCSNTKSGTNANNYGFYSLSLNSKDSIGLVYTAVGYQPKAFKIGPGQNITLDILLESSSKTLEEVTVKATRNDDNLRRTEMGVIEVPLKMANTLPVVFGEKDVLKIIQLLPGVQGGNEGTTGFYVRGGNSDQNLIQLDEATVYNPNHLFGLFSTFNSNALNKVTLIKGGFPAQYGGRLSSVLDITMKEGNNKKYAAQGGIGLISSNITLEGPLKKERGSFIVSGRRTYIDLLAKPFIKGFGYTFYDLNAKLNYQLGKKEKIYLSGFYGKDNAQYTGSSSLNYGIGFGNNAATFRWNHIFGQKMFSNTSVILNNYNLGLSTIQGKYVDQIYTAIKDVNAKTDFEYYPNLKNNIKFGFNYSYHTFTPLAAAAKVKKDGSIPKFNTDSLLHSYTNEAAFYLNDEIKFSEAVSANVGLRVPHFFTSQVQYTFLEPRISFRVSIDPNTSIKASYTEMNQFLHLIPNSTASLPTDIWIPASKITLPQNSRQIALGLFKNFSDNSLKTSLEIYYKNMRNQALFKQGTLLTQGGSDLETFLTFGKGYSYGAELMLEKNIGKFNGWISYTLSWTNQIFKELNRGQVFPFAYDRRHNLSVVGSYELSPKWTLSGAFVFNTGRPYTLPIGRVDIGYGGSLYNGTYSDYSTRNNYRLRSYNRLDISAIYKKKRKLFGKTYDSEWVFSAYNLYSRRNPYFVYLTTDEVTKVPKATQVSLLPIVPSVTYNFKF